MDKKTFKSQVWIYCADTQVPECIESFYKGCDHTEGTIGVQFLGAPLEWDCQLSGGTSKKLQCMVKKLLVHQ